MRVNNNIFRFLLALLAICPFLSLYSVDDLLCDQNRLINDLLIVNYWNDRLNERLPVTYNHLLQGGYFSMPSARMGNDGEIGAGFSYVPPYHNYNLRCQLFKQLELSLNYRVFRGVKDPVLGQFGYGDFSDKGANIKFALFSPEDSQYRLPGIAFGLEDFMGTKAFNAQYVVLTQVFLKYHLEVSLGYGGHRIKGLFGGLNWMPFRKASNFYIRNLSFTLEYDATNYKDPKHEPHPKGRKQKTPWNVGLKYRLWDIDFSVAYIKGNTFAFSASAFYNFGNTKGLLPKLKDCLPYRSPVVIEELGCLRTEEALVQDFLYALFEQGFVLMKAWISHECGQRTLRLEVINAIYRTEPAVRERLNAILSCLTPTNIDKIIVTIAAPDAPIQAYHYQNVYLQAYREQSIGRHELNILTPLCEVTKPNPYQSKLLFARRNGAFNFEFFPKTQFLFGSAKGKFKYALGVGISFNGFIYGDLYYIISLGFTPLSNLYNISDVDRLNPSQIINVRTDIINYYKEKGITVDQAYIQKTTNLGKGWFARTAIGLFEIEYGGAAGEFLYYPVSSDWAFGLEGAVVKKRTVGGVGFTSRIRKLHHFTPTYRRFIGSQFFINAYYDLKCLSLDIKVSIGKFLANDWGIRTDVCRYFPSGLRLSFWYTYTGAKDIINGQQYHDTGVMFSVPLDIFYTHTSRHRWGYGMSAWLRDVGVKACTGNELYYLIHDQRVRQ